MAWLILASIIAIASVGFYFTEFYGEGNKRAPRDPEATYDTRTMAYPKYRETPEWQAIRQMALNRDGYRCRKCGSTERLQVHHRTYARRGWEKLKDLETLCDDCHKAEHTPKR